MGPGLRRDDSEFADPDFSNSRQHSRGMICPGSAISLPSDVIVDYLNCGFSQQARWPSRLLRPKPRPGSGSAKPAGPGSASSTGRATPLLWLPPAPGGGACGDPMRQTAVIAMLVQACRFVAVVMLASLMAGCWSDPAPTGSVSRCVTEHFPSYNPKDREQCIAACIKCEHGVVTTCATACSLKSSR
jgi:hypothetical protein